MSLAHVCLAEIRLVASENVECVLYYPLHEKINESSHGRGCIFEILK